MLLFFTDIIYNANEDGRYSYSISVMRNRRLLLFEKAPGQSFLRKLIVRENASFTKMHFYRKLQKCFIFQLKNCKLFPSGNEEWVRDA